MWKCWWHRSTPRRARSSRMPSECVRQGAARAIASSGPRYRIAGELPTYTRVNKMLLPGTAVTIMRCEDILLASSMIIVGKPDTTTKRKLRAKSLGEEGGIKHLLVGCSVAYYNRDSYGAVHNRHVNHGTTTGDTHERFPKISIHFKTGTEM